MEANAEDRPLPHTTIVGDLKHLKCHQLGDPQGQSLTLEILCPLSSAILKARTLKEDNDGT